MNLAAHEDWSLPWHALQRRLAEGAIGETAAAAAMRARAAKAPRPAPARTWIARIPANLRRPATPIS